MDWLIDLKLGSYDLTFFGSVALAVVVVFLFSMSKFEESTIAKNEDDFISQLLPRYLATPEQYSRALIFYVTAMAGFVVALSFLGPHVWGVYAKEVPQAPNALPLFIALVLVGFLPNVPWLQQVELKLRQYAHERAFIPKAARATADRLASAEFNYTPYQMTQILRSPAMRGVEAADFAAPRDTIEYAWARLSCLLYRVKYLEDSGLSTELDGDVLDRYARDLESLALKRRSLEDEIAQYRKLKQDNPYYSDDALHTSIRKTLRKLYVLLGCAVRLKLYNDTEVNPTVAAFGFMLNSGQAEPGRNNLMITGLAVMAAAIFAIVFVAVGIGDAASAYGLWQRSPGFPKEYFDAFIWSLSAVLAHGAAILVADRMRGSRMAQGRWLAKVGPNRQRLPANYILVVLVCGVVSYVVLFGLSIVVAPPSVDVAKSILSYTLLPVASSGFYIFHLDNVELKTRPRRRVEISLQALTTGACGFVAVSVSLEVLGVTIAQAYDFVLLVTAFGVAIGTSLAWYIPQAAQQAKYDPLSEALEARLAILRAEAVKCLGSAELANNWVEKPNAGLDNKSPRSASTDIALFEKALALLQNGPVPTLAAAQGRPN